MSVSDSAFRFELSILRKAKAAHDVTLASLCLTLSLTCVQADSHTPATSTTHALIQKPRHSLLDIRFENIVKQKLDFSCGAAAVSTLLTYYFEDPTPESEILAILENTLSDEQKHDRAVTGFSLLDLKNAVAEKGYAAAGYRLSFEQLGQLTAPVIVYVEPFGYKHFAVLRGVAGERVWLADPSRGNLRMSRYRFEDEWGGIVFVLGKEGESDIGPHPLGLGRASDRVSDRLRLQRHLDIDDRLPRTSMSLPPSLHR